MSSISDNSLADAIVLKHRNSDMQNQSAGSYIRNSDKTNSNDSSLQNNSNTDTVSLNSQKTYSTSVIQVTYETRNYISSASFRAGEHSDFFQESTSALWNNDKLQYAYHEFASSLSNEDLDNFLTAMEQNPDNLTQFMDIASKLSDEALSPFLEGAALAGNEVDEFLASVNELLDGEIGKFSSFQYAFMSAGVSRGNDIMDFVRDVGEMSDQTLDDLADFAKTISDISNDMNQNMDLFATVLGTCDEKNLQDFMHLASKGSSTDTTHLLTAASSLSNNDLDRFIQQANKYAGDTSTSLSNYLEVASDAQARLDTFMDISSDLDLSQITNLSSVDTVNFLDAAQRHPDNINELTQTGLELSGTNRSHFFFAAANAATNVETLMENAQSLSDQDLSSYLLIQANNGAYTIDDTIFMTSVLTRDKYSDFKSTADNLDSRGLETLMDTTDSLSGLRRSQFLEAGAASQGRAGDFLTMFNSMSTATQSEYLDTSSRLSGENQENFVQASVNAKGELENYMEITNELLDEIDYFPNCNVEYQESTLGMFLSLSQKSDSEELQGFISLVGKLDTDSEHATGNNGFDNFSKFNGLRSSFIRVAYTSGLEMADINQLGNQALTLGEDRFRDIFGMDNLVAGNTNLSGTDYENLINAAKTQDDDAWDDTCLLTFYRDYPGIDQLV